jgi:hypothetical protein
VPEHQTGQRPRVTALGTKVVFPFAIGIPIDEVYGSGGRVLVWLHALLFDANLSTPARTFAELWVRPARLTDEIAGFLDRVWADGEPLAPGPGTQA